MNEKIKKIFVITLVFVITASTMALCVKADQPEINLSKIKQLKESHKIEHLVIDAPSSVMEGESFMIWVSAEEAPVGSATVVFLNGTYFTNQNGTAILNAPFVEETTDYEIIASKPGYTQAIEYITVIDIETQLVIDAPSSVMEGESFMVMVTANSIPIPNVTIFFANMTYFTNMNGSAVLTAPLVDHHANYSIYASKDGYLPDIAWLMVLDSTN